MLIILAVIAAILLLALVLVSIPVFAHHGTAAFQNEKRVTLKGTVTEWLWSNPHCLLQFDVTGDDGKVVHWVGETQNPVSMTDRGWSKAAIKAGQSLSSEEQRELIRQLESADARQSCCHGRPTMIHLSLDALARQFDRR